MRYDHLDVIVHADRQQLGAAAAKDVSEKIQALLAHKEVINIIFAAAPSQNEFLAGLRADTAIPWDRINAFHMDEYLGLPADASQSFGNFLKRGLFSHVNFRSVNYIDGNPDNIDKECNRYGGLLAANPPDIVCLGIGENTHIAFNEPGQADFNDPVTVKVVALDPVCRQQQVNDGCFATIDRVPVQALTLTVPVLFSGTHLFAMVPGKMKAQAIRDTLTQPVSIFHPSTILRTHPDVKLYVDKDSASLIPVSQ